MARPLAEGDLDLPLAVAEDGVTEIVVHGVGGSTPAAMLDDATAGQITGDATAGMWRGRDGVTAGGTRWHREAYVWGGLTSRAFSTALWLLLTPFSLINLAGWMTLGGVGRDGRPDWRVGYQQSLVRVLALAATLTYVLFVGQIAMDLGAWQCTQIDRCRIQDWARGLSPQLAEQPARVVVVAAAVPLMFVLALHLLAGRTRNNYENYEPAEAAEPAEEHARLDVPPADVAAMSFSDKDFWAGRLYAERSRWLHAIASVILVAALLLCVVDTTDLNVAVVGTLWSAIGACLATLTVAAGWQWARQKLLGGVKRLSVAAAVALSLLAVAATLAWVRPAPIRPGRPGMMPGVMQAFNVLLIAVFGVALLHAAVALSVRYGRSRKHLRAVPKVPGPAIAVTVGVWLLFAVWAGAVVWIARWLSPTAVAGQDNPSQRLTYPIPYKALAQFSLLGVLLVLAVVGGYVLMLGVTRYPDLDREEGAWRQVEQDDLIPASPRWKRRVRRIKFTANAADWIEVGLSALATLAAVVPLGYGVWFGVEWLGWTAVLSLACAAGSLGAGLTALAWNTRRRRSTPEGPGSSMPSVGPGIGSSRAAGVVAFLGAVGLATLLTALQIDALRTPQPAGPGLDRFLPLSDGLTSTLLTAIPVTTVVLIRRAIKNPETRRHIGAAWDFATFWPRPFHPLAPPPYAERAVPELGHRIRHLLAGNHAVLVLGHSQGAVITVATLAQLAGKLPAEQLRRLSVITYGNPVRRLYLRWFPEYTRRMISDLGLTGHPGDDGATCPQLVNFHRFTDPIGRHLFAGPTDPRERWLPDPPLGRYRRGDGEPLIRGHAHDGYVKQHDFRQYSLAEIDRLASCAREAEQASAPVP